MPKNIAWVVLRRLLEIALGVVFFYAGLQKHWHPYEFAEAILAYRLLPEPMVGLVAAGLPWLELAAGLFLAVGLKPRSSLLLMALLAGGFLLVMILTLARGLKIDCGCGLFMPREIGLGTILVDLGFLAWAAGLYYWELRRTARASS